MGIKTFEKQDIFVGYINDSFVLLHHFTKKTQKTPKKEIIKAKKEYQEILESEVNKDEK